MEMNAEAVSGQVTGNTGQASDPLSSAISAAVKASTDSAGKQDDLEEILEPSVEQTAETKRGTEDADATKPATDVKTEAEAPKFEPPQHWPEDRRKAFGALPPEHQKLIKELAKDLEGGFTRKSQELGDKARFADAVSGLFDDATKGQLAQAGMTPVQYLQYLHRVQQFASSDRVGYAKWVMQQLGLTPQELGFGADQQGKTEAQDTSSLEALLSDPKVKLLEDKFSKVEERLSSWEKQALQAEQMRRQQSEAQLLQGIQSFRFQQDDNGQLMYPHFDQVHAQMAALMESIPEIRAMQDGHDKMKAAYDAALWARPDLRTTLLETEASKRAAALEKQREAERAKRVTAVKPSTSVATQKAGPKTLDDHIREAMGR